MTNIDKNPRFGFFGTPDRAVIVLEELKKIGWLPEIIITAPDKPVGRKQILTAPEVKIWAKQNEIENIFQPQDKKELLSLKEELEKTECDFFLVVAYGYLIPEEILEIPKHHSINVHYSTLPFWRGASPVVQQILHGEKELGLTIMKMDAGLDTGPIIHQETLPMPEPLPTTQEAARLLSCRAGEILPDILTKWINKEINARPQDDSKATYCYKIKKTDAQIDFSDSEQINWQKIQAYTPWPRAYFFVNKNNDSIRVVVNEAKFTDNKLDLVSLTPAGLKPMSWQQFTNWLGYDPKN